MLHLRQATDFKDEVAMVCKYTDDLGKIAFAKSKVAAVMESEMHMQEIEGMFVAKKARHDRLDSRECFAFLQAWFCMSS